MLQSASTPTQNKLPSIQTAEELPSISLMWRAVLAQAIRDIYSGTPQERKDVLLWMRTEDFEIVCDYACVEYTQMMDQMASLAIMPAILARKYGKELRNHVMSGVHYQD